MGLNQYLGISVTIIAFMFGFIILYARSFTKTIADETARLITLAQKTNIEEAVRAEFKKQTNTHQIVTSEYAKMRFVRLDELVNSLYDLKSRTEAFLIMPAIKTDKDFKDLSEKFLIANGIAHKAINMAAMYIDDYVRDLTEGFMQNCIQALGISTSVHVSKGIMNDHKNAEENEVRSQFIRDYLDASKDLRRALDNLPAIFKALQAEYKAHLKEF